MTFIIDFFKKLKRGGKTPRCPNCKSQKIATSSPLDGWITPVRYLCSQCGYSGYVVLEVEDEKGG